MGYGYVFVSWRTLSMHIKMHYTPTPLQKKQKHKAYLRKRCQNGTRCRDGVKVLWCQSWAPHGGKGSSSVVLLNTWMLFTESESSVSSATKSFF